MNALSGPGAIRFGVETNAEECVSSATLLSRRPVGFGRIFIGKRADETPAVAAQLFSLCGFSHGAASRLALAAASGRAETLSERFSIAIGLSAELIVESLRSMALGWPRADGAEAAARAAAPLRDALRAARVIHAAAMSGDALARRVELVSPAGAILEAAARLGWRQETPDAPATGSLLAATMKEAAAADFLPPNAPDALLPVDDHAVIETLRRGREGFAAAPTLPGRVVETGAYARHWRKAAKNNSAVAARFAARCLSIRESAELLRGLLQKGEDRGTAMMAADGAGGEGYAAVETARGRLYHWVRADSQARICDYEILAPTAWNFHPAGPFAAALLGARVGAGEAARQRIRRLAAVFDPCVAFQLELSEREHA